MKEQRNPSVDGERIASIMLTETRRRIAARYEAAARFTFEKMQAIAPFGISIDMHMLYEQQLKAAAQYGGEDWQAVKRRVENGS